MPVEVVPKLEEYLDEQAAMTTSVMKDRLLSDLAVDVSISSIHCALHGQWTFDEEEATYLILKSHLSRHPKRRAARVVKTVAERSQETEVDLTAEDEVRAEILEDARDVAISAVGGAAKMPVVDTIDLVSEDTSGFELLDSEGEPVLLAGENKKP
ncbi:hypothetical protein PC114_g5520 [Phytophthora cactorum]|uniref:Uncharacterized protein n=1 Tax=Phytophthora cactorum TaxID=29920 RepID=A0A8T1D9E9_9STRA|nr:hypothetical protein PC114_g5520 [Phytophthora cactorum]KAG2937305.1 hypothetical protein PC115_g4288 [Phytophthora cactorum]KAG3098862.1 hypothetical protein PC122_g3835 [Phytophthora cactorum]